VGAVTIGTLVAYIRAEDSDFDRGVSVAASALSGPR